MRRKDMEMNDQQEIEAFLQEISYGFLGMNDEDGWPRVIPINYVFWNDYIYMHGSKVGEKISKMRSSNKVTFSVAKEYAIIPSYFTDEIFACPATAFFKSVIIRGYAEILEDVEEKAKALSAFMRKLQPEGKYTPIDHHDPQYATRIQGVAVIKVKIDTLSAKFKFGQNANEQDRNDIMEGLKHREQAQDDETIAMMKKYCPHHQ